LYFLSQNTGKDLSSSHQIKSIQQTSFWSVDTSLDNASVDATSPSFFPLNSFEVSGVYVKKFNLLPNSRR